MYIILLLSPLLSLSLLSPLLSLSLILLLSPLLSFSLSLSFFSSLPYSFPPLLFLSLSPSLFPSLLTVSPPLSLLLFTPLSLPQTIQRQRTRRVLCGQAHPSQLPGSHPHTSRSSRSEDSRGRFSQFRLFQWHSVRCACAVPKH